MIRTLTLAALMAAVFAMPAVAEEAAKPGKEARLEQMKAKHAEMHQKREGKIAERRAAWDAHRKDCHAKMKAAETPEKAKYVREQCKSEGKARHGKFKGERTADKAQWEAKRGEMKAKREEWKAKHDAHRAEMKATREGAKAE